MIAPVPFNFAVLGEDRAQDAMCAFPSIKRWAIGGHSLGSVAAAMFATGHLDTIRGLLLEAAYPVDNDDLSKSNLRVVSPDETQDKLAKDKVDAERGLLPPTTKFVVIDGGNHGQFGWYGAQPGDGVATISREEQQKQADNATVDFLKQLGN